MSALSKAIFLAAFAFAASETYAAGPYIPQKTLANFPIEEPLRERTLVLDDHSSWTRLKGEKAVPLAVASLSAKTIVSLTGGWLVLGPELEFDQTSLDFLYLEGTTWIAPVGEAVAYVSSAKSDAGGKLGVMYPEVGVTAQKPLDVPEISQFAVTDRGFFYAQGRRTSGQAHWNKRLREEQPLPFFPSDLTCAVDGTPWGCDSLQARPWTREGDFWKPLDIPEAPSRLTGISPFVDSSGYFACGAGWVGAFASDGKRLWTRDTDFSGRALPRDVRLRTGAGRVYLWSSSQRQLWVWAWNSEGPQGPLLPPSPDRLLDQLRLEVERLEALGSVWEARSLAQTAQELCKDVLGTQPFAEPWRHAREDFSKTIARLREREIGNGVLTMSWSLPYGKPLATWNWEPDASLSAVKLWKVQSQPFWEGKPWGKQEFRFAARADRTPWPGVETWNHSNLQLPSWLDLAVVADGGKLAKDLPTASVVPSANVAGAAAHWARVWLPIPPQPYDLPVE